MPVIDPRASHAMPHDWRVAYDAYRRLMALARKVNEPVSTWRIEFPGKAKRIVDNSWKMTYTWRGSIYSNVFLGSDGKSSAHTIESLIPVYEKLVNQILNNSSGQTSSSQTRSKIWDDNYNRRLIEKFNFEVVGLKTIEDHREFQRRNAKLIKFMESKVGYLSTLNLTVQEYWFRHPHSRLFPSPPQDKEQYERRQKAYESYLKDKEQAVKHQRDAGTYTGNL